MIKFLIILFLGISSFSTFALNEADKLRAIEAMIQKEGINKVITQFIAMEHNQLPIKKDNIDTIVSVFYIKDTKAKVYKHALTSGWTKIISKMTKVSEKDARQYMPELMQKQSINSLCSNKLNLIYFNYGVKIINIYSEQDGTKLFETTVNKSDCNV